MYNLSSILKHGEEPVVALRLWLEKAYGAQYCVAFDESLKAPQFGPYHNEGDTMADHLNLMISVFENAIMGVIEPNLDPRLSYMLKEFFTDISPEHADRMVEFIVFHDIEKINCLSVKLKNNKTSGSFRVTGNLRKIQRAIRNNTHSYELNPNEYHTLQAVSYFQLGKNPKDHATESSNNYRDILPLVVGDAIEFSGVVHGFEKVNPEQFARNILAKRDSFSGEFFRFLFATAYVDLMASLGYDGQPNIQKLENFYQSYLQALVPENPGAILMALEEGKRKK